MELLNNKYVKNCTSKNIKFTKDCKIKALKLEEKKWIPKKERFDKSKMTKDEYIEYLEREDSVLK